MGNTVDKQPPAQSERIEECADPKCNCHHWAAQSTEVKLQRLWNEIEPRLSPEEKLELLSELDLKEPQNINDIVFWAKKVVELEPLETRGEFAHAIEMLNQSLKEGQ